MVFVRYLLFVIPQRHINVPANIFHRDKPTGSRPPSVFYSLLITHYSLLITHCLLLIVYYSLAFRVFHVTAP